MSLKTLKKWMIFISIILSICLSAWICLHFILTLEEMNEYKIVYKFWYGVKDASAFCAVLLAALWLFVFIFSIFRAVIDSFDERRNDTISYNGFYDKDLIDEDEKDDYDYYVESDEDDDWEYYMNL